MRYNIKLLSFINLGLSILFILIILPLIFALLTPKILPNTPNVVVLVLTIFLIIGFILQKFASRWTIWTFDKKGINVEWTKQFAFRNNKAFTIMWSEIKSCEKLRGARFYNSSIIIETKATELYSLYLVHSFKESDYNYQAFFKDLKENIELNNLTLD